VLVEAMIPHAVSSDQRDRGRKIYLKMADRTWSIDRIWLFKSTLAGLAVVTDTPVAVFGCLQYDLGGTLNREAEVA
jgi:hypothetical protein